MKRKVILITLMLNFTLFLGLNLKAQTEIQAGVQTDVLTEIQANAHIDAYFTYDLEKRSDDVSGYNGLTFVDFYGQGFNNYQGLDFDGFTNHSNNDVCAGNGILMMAATGFFYLINKKRKENK